MSDPIDFQALAEFAIIHGSASVDQIEQMAKNPRMPEIEVEKRQRWIPLLRQNVIVLRAVAASPEAQAAILKQIAKSREAA